MKDNGEFWCQIGTYIYKHVQQCPSSPRSHQRSVCSYVYCRRERLNSSGSSCLRRSKVHQDTVDDSVSIRCRMEYILHQTEHYICNLILIYTNLSSISDASSQNAAQRCMEDPWKFVVSRYRPPLSLFLSLSFSLLHHLIMSTVF